MSAVSGRWAVVLPLALVLAACSPGEPTASPSRFLTIETVGVVAAREYVGQGVGRQIRYTLDDGRTLDVDPATLDQITGFPNVGALLLMGTGDRPWIMVASRVGSREPACYMLSHPAFDRGGTVQVDLQGEGILTFPKAPGYKNYGTNSDSKILQRGQCIDSRGRALGSDAGG